MIQPSLPLTSTLTIRKDRSQVQGNHLVQKTRKHDILEHAARQATPQEQLPPISLPLKELSIDRERFTIYPACQRKSVWTPRLRQALIDTILRGDPVMPLEGYTWTAENGQTFWGITDGHQRIDAILDFIDGVYKTWTWPMKQKKEPNSDFPVAPGCFFDQLPLTAKNYFLDYRIYINKIRQGTAQQISTRFLRIQNHIPLAAAEKLNAYTSHAKDVAKQIEAHPFWEDFYTGHTNREQVFQSSLHLLAVELCPSHLIDLQGTVYLHALAAGHHDRHVTAEVVERLLRRMDAMADLYAGLSFSIRAATIAMYQSVCFLEEAGALLQPSDRGKLAGWMQSLLAESSRFTLPAYIRPIQRLIVRSVQQEFWTRHRVSVFRLMDASRLLPKEG